MTITTATYGAATPGASAPPWVPWMMLLADRLPRTILEPGVGPRAVVATPTTRHIAPAMAVVSSRQFSASFPAPSLGTRVATVLDRAFTEAEVGSGSVAGRIRLNGTQFEGGRVPPYAVLPERWDFERTRHEQLSAVMMARAVHLGDGQTAEWSFLRMCLEPVVFITSRPGEAISDLADLATRNAWWNPVQMAALADAREGLNLWFRRPIIITSPAALQNAPWVSDLPVRMVVVSGFSAWSSSTRHLWSSAPHILVLNQRSNDVADFRDWFDGTVFPTVGFPTAKEERLRAIRSSGLTMTVFGEHVLTADIASGGSVDYEWEF